MLDYFISHGKTDVSVSQTHLSVLNALQKVVYLARRRIPRTFFNSKTSKILNQFALLSRCQRQRRFTDFS